MIVLETERLPLRRWTDADFEPFAAMNADPRGMRHFPATKMTLTIPNFPRATRCIDMFCTVFRGLTGALATATVPLEH